jgi:hypothetical protein
VLVRTDEANINYEELKREDRNGYGMCAATALECKGLVKGKLRRARARAARTEIQQLTDAALNPAAQHLAGYSPRKPRPRV